MFRRLELEELQSQYITFERAPLPWLRLQEAIYDWGSVGEESKLFGILTGPYIFIFFLITIKLKKAVNGHLSNYFY